MGGTISTPIPRPHSRREQTAAFVADRLESFRVSKCIEGLAKTGGRSACSVNGSGRDAIGLRADLDALHILERSGVPLRVAQTRVRMHACGHDRPYDDAAGRGAGADAHRKRVNGTVYFIFQPAEGERRRAAG